MYGKISRVVKARITRVPQARVQYGALTTSGILPYAFDNVFIICLCMKREMPTRQFAVQVSHSAKAESSSAHAAKVTAGD